MIRSYVINNDKNVVESRADYESLPIFSDGQYLYDVFQDDGDERYSDMEMLLKRPSSRGLIVLRVEGAQALGNVF